MTVDSKIRDQAYQFFIAESLEFLQTIEDGLLRIQTDHDIPHIHELMRAAHSIKGGSASVGLVSIQTIAHRLEDVFRALYRQDVEVGQELEERLLRAYDCLRLPLLEEIQTGHHDREGAIQQADPIFNHLEAYFGDVLHAEQDLPSAAELGIDIVQVIFSGDVADGLARLERVLAQPEISVVAGEIRAQAEVFIGVGELVNLPGFVAIANTALTALNHHPDQALTIGQQVLDDFRSAQASVLAGDRTEGGQPSAKLLAFTDKVDARLSEDLEESSMLSLTDTDDLEALFGTHVQGLESLAIEHERGTGHPMIAALPDNRLGSPIADPASFSEIEALFGGLGDWQDSPSLSVSELDIYSPEKNTSTIALNENDPDNNLDHDLGHEVEEDFFLLESSQNITSADGTFPISDLSIESSPSVDVAIANPPTAPTQSQPSDAEEPAKNKTVTTASYRQTIKPANSGSTTSYVSQTVRVELARLERLNNLVGGLVTQENQAILQTQQMQGLITRVMQRVGQFEQVTRELQDWTDHSQRERVRLQSHRRSLRSRSAETRVMTAESAIGLPNSTTLPTFDPLQLDSYHSLYTLVQEVIEEMAQVAEGLRDMASVTQQSQQTQHHKQQTLKQLRSDLLRARMFPVGEVLQRFPRMVRDLCHQYGKQVTVKVSGENTLMDKAVLEKLFDPLVHLMRNAFDHGIETSPIRQQQGKPAQATIEIRAFHRGNQTCIEVRDDGKGIDPNKIRERAIALNLLSREQAAALTPDRLFELLFAPGFSTAEQVGELSGRGVGLDAVQTQVRHLKGHVSLTSELGRGTVFSLHFPLTLTIANLLVFQMQSHVMAIPVDTLEGIVLITRDEIQAQGDRWVYDWNGRSLPIVLPQALIHHYVRPHTTEEPLSPIPLPLEGKIPLLVIAGETEMAGLPVDQIIQEQELVIKPFGAAITPPSYLYGCSILGDGSMVPVIDGSALVATKLRASTTTEIGWTQETVPQIQPTTNARTILVVDDSLTTRQTLTTTLQKAGYNVVQGRDGREAIAHLQADPTIRAVFCDVEMPGMNGFEFLNQYRQLALESHPPVMMLSSRSSEKHQRIATYLGAKAYLTKPYLEQELLSVLNAQLLEYSE